MLPLCYIDICRNVNAALAAQALTTSNKQTKNKETKKKRTLITVGRVL